MSGVDERIARLMELRQAQVGPDTDPGDVTIRVQDDSAMVTVHIDGLMPFSPLGIGGTVEEALDAAIQNLLPGFDDIRGMFADP